MTARDGVATDLAPLRFTDRVAMKSSALPAVELIPEWDKAIESGHSGVRLIEMPLQANIFSLYVESVIKSGKLLYQKRAFMRRRLIVACRCCGETAPECFEIEARLREELDIPVMHDDQHGTAIISGAALLNGLEIAGKSIADARVVINGAGAAAVSIARLFLKLGLNCENLVLCDSKGVVSTRREDLNPVKEQLATDREDVDTLADALQGADVFLGVSAPGILTPEMVRTMAHDPLVLALANPTPEITYEEAMASRPDIIFATGRSDYPNQVNNVLAFPYLFRGALDVYASTINDEMKLAVTHALARLAKEPVPQEVLKTYGLKSLSFGREYLIPKPSDPRLLAVVATAVARAAIESGVARREIEDWDAYAASLTRRVKNTK